MNNNLELVQQNLQNNKRLVVIQSEHTIMFRYMKIYEMNMDISEL